MQHWSGCSIHTISNTQYYYRGAILACKVNIFVSYMSLISQSCYYFNFSAVTDVMMCEMSVQA